MSATRLRQNAWNHAKWLLTFFLYETKCHFCKRPLLTDTLFTSDWWKLGKLITLHHKNHDHEDNRAGNRAPAHVTCHRSFHMKLQQKLKRETNSERDTKNE